MGTNAQELFKQGRLAEALAAATVEVKARPADAAARWFLAELLCFSGNFERADLQLDVVAQLREGTQALGITLFRQLIRAEQARQQFFSEGRVPDLLEEAGVEIKAALMASLRIREGDQEGAGRVMREAEAVRVKSPAAVNGEQAEDWRDLDDVMAGVMEVFGGDGKYYWVTVGAVESLEFESPARARDLLWRKARLTVRNGATGEVYVPAIYAGSAGHGEDAIKLGRATEWEEADGGLVRGKGLKTFWVGEKDLTIMEMETIESAAVEAGGGK